jgi:hypothetical protein
MCFHPVYPVNPVYPCSFLLRFYLDCYLKKSGLSIDALRPLAHMG